MSCSHTGKTSKGRSRTPTCSSPNYRQSMPGRQAHSGLSSRHNRTDSSSLLANACLQDMNYTAHCRSCFSMCTLGIGRRPHQVL